MFFLQTFTPYLKFKYDVFIWSHYSDFDLDYSDYHYVKLNSNFMDQSKFDGD
jgi:hypothetical protein